MSSDRFEVDFTGELVIKETELMESKKLKEFLKAICTRNNWQVVSLDGDNCYLNLRLRNILGETNEYHIYIANVRNELRSPYEKKIQLGGRNPLENPRENTVILGVYVFEKNADFTEHILVGYKIDPFGNYLSNPSLRGVFTDGILQKAKINGFEYNSMKKLVAFRPEFIFYYLQNFNQFHYGESDGIEGSKLIGGPTDGPVVVEEVEPIEPLSTPFNNIIYGAPGTGKSYEIEKVRKTYFSNPTSYERVTFYPSYSYNQFMGTYKPVSLPGKDSEVVYKFIPGPFLRMWIKSYRSKMLNENKKYLLILEEINRANVATVFGDIFQLLDRKDGESEYSISLNEDIKNYLFEEFSKPIKENEWFNTISEEKKVEVISTIKLHSNFYLLATMNTADQGVFPIDAAFKRRWNLSYMSLNENEEENDVIVNLNGQNINWNNLRRNINNQLAKIGLNEDRMLGPFFISNSDLMTNFEQVFINKLLMYLFEDVVKYKKNDFFIAGMNTFSKLIESYKQIGGKIFNFWLDYEPELVVTPLETESEEEAKQTAKGPTKAEEEADV